MRFQLTEELETFAKEVVDLVVPKNTRGWRKKIEELWIDIQERGLSERTESTQKLYMSKFRSAVKDRLREQETDTKRYNRLEADLTKIISIDPEIMTRLKEDYDDTINEGNANLIQVPKWEKVLEMAREMMRSGDMELRALGLIMMTGRRFRELLQTGELSLIQSENGSRRTQRWLLDFSGQLKTKEGEGTMYEKTFAIPTLAPAKEVLRYFNGLRESKLGKAWMDMSPELLNKRVNQALNKRLKRSEIANYWPAGKSLTIKELRALYAEVAYKNFHPKMIRAHYFSAILGHSKEDQETALSYMKYILTDEDLQPRMDEINEIVALRDKRTEEARAAKRMAEAEEDDFEVVEE